MYTMKKSNALTTLSLAILGLLSRRARSGYDLHKLFSTPAMGSFSRSHGAIYPALEKLEARGLIEGRIEREGTLHPRKVYTLTAEGQEALRQRLAQPLTHEDVVQRQGDLLMRFVFIDEVLGREETLRFLDEFLAFSEAYVASLREQLDGFPQEAPLPPRFAMEHGIARHRADVTWANRIIERLRGGES